MGLPRRFCLERIFLSETSRHMLSVFFFFLLFLQKHMFSTFRLCEMEYGLSLLQSGGKKREKDLLKELYVKVRKVLYTMNRFPFLLWWGKEPNVCPCFGTRKTFLGQRLKSPSRYLCWMRMIDCKSQIKKARPCL